MTLRTAQKVKQKAKTEVVTKEQSFSLVKNVLRASISSIAYMRNLFDPECFEGMRVGDLVISKLVANGNREVKTLVNWLEYGVFDALQRRYLDTVLFEIYQCSEKDVRQASMKTVLKKKVEGLKLLECYSFEIKYPANEGACVELQTHDQSRRTGTSSQSNITRENAMQATTHVIRSLINLTNTLNPLPSSRIISVKLLYRDEVTPSDYEPPFFIASKGGLVSWFSEKPLRLHAGKVTTPYHTLNINIRSASDALNAGNSVDGHNRGQPKNVQSQPQNDMKGLLNVTVKTKSSQKNSQKGNIKTETDDDSDFEEKKCRVKLRLTGLSDKQKTEVSTLQENHVEKVRTTTTAKPRSRISKRPRATADPTTESVAPSLVHIGTRKVSEIDAPVGQVRRSKRLRKMFANESETQDNST